MLILQIYHLLLILLTGIISKFLIMAGARAGASGMVWPVHGMTLDNQGCVKLCIAASLCFMVLLLHTSERPTANVNIDATFNCTVHHSSSAELRYCCHLRRYLRLLLLILDIVTVTLARRYFALSINCHNGERQTPSGKESVE